jgi:hypothetical protein
VLESFSNLYCSYSLCTVLLMHPQYPPEYVLGQLNHLYCSYSLCTVLLMHPQQPPEHVLEQLRVLEAYQQAEVPEFSPLGIHPICTALVEGKTKVCVLLQGGVTGPHT